MIYKYIQSDIKGVYLLTPPLFKDNRGSVTKTFHKPSFDTLNLKSDFGESLVTENFQRGTVRGFHFQRPPYSQAKTIYCFKGAILNLVLDIRVGSPTYGQIRSFDLSSENHNILYVPEGMANLYIIKEDNTIILYNLTSKYMQDFEGGVRWDSIDYDYPINQPIISEKDLLLPKWENFKSPFIYRENKV